VDLERDRHLIGELLPAKNGYRYSNSDPVTGQAAWYDLRVRVEKASAAEAGVTSPRLPDVAAPPRMPDRPPVLRFGGEWKPR
jgi:hypothetical protein